MEDAPNRNAQENRDTAQRLFCNHKDRMNDTIANIKFTNWSLRPHCSIPTTVQAQIRHYLRR